MQFDSASKNSELVNYTTLPKTVSVAVSNKVLS